MYISIINYLVTIEGRDTIQSNYLKQNARWTRIMHFYNTNDFNFVVSWKLQKPDCQHCSLK